MAVFANNSGTNASFLDDVNKIENYVAIITMTTTITAVMPTRSLYN